MQYALCYGAWSGGADGDSKNHVELVGVFADDKLVPFTSGRKAGHLEPLFVTIDQPNQFGGDKQEGGLVGEIRFYEGTDWRAASSDVQNADAYLAACQGRSVPAYRGICYAIFGRLGTNGAHEPFYIGSTSYVKTLGFLIRRLANPLGYIDANPYPKYKTPLASVGSGRAASFYERTTQTLWWIENVIDDGVITHFTIRKLDLASGYTHDTPIETATFYVGQPEINIYSVVATGSNRGNICLGVAAGCGSIDLVWFDWSGRYLGNAGGCNVSHHWATDLSLSEGNGCSTVNSDGNLVYVDCKGRVWVCWPVPPMVPNLGYFLVGLVYYNSSISYNNRSVVVQDASHGIYVFSWDLPTNGAHNYVSQVGSTDCTHFAIVDGAGAPSATGYPIGGIYIPNDNTIIWRTTEGFYKWDIATKKVIASFAAPVSSIGMSQWLGDDGFILDGASLFDPIGMAYVTTIALSWYTLPHLGDQTNFFHQYDATNKAFYYLDGGFNTLGTVQKLSTEVTDLGVHDVGGDANPALVVYDLLTHPVYGLRKSPTTIDLDSFDVAARTLAGEGIGVSMIVDTATDADSLISEILRYADGVLYCDPETGLYTIKLARADYDPSSLPVLDVDAILEPPDFCRGSWSETTNEVKITYTDRASNWQQNVSAPAQDTANITILGTLNSETIDFKGISNETTATLIAARALRTLSYPLAKLSIKANRKAWKLRPGGCFRFTWAPLGIDDEVFRVAKIGFGKVDDGTITIDAVEDIFGLSTVAFTPPGGSGWIDPASDPVAPLAQIAIETPWAMLPTTTAEVRVQAGAVRADSLSMGFEVWTDDGGTFHYIASGGHFLPSGTLSALYTRKTDALDATGFTLANAVDLSSLLGTDSGGRIRGDCLLLFADTGELCAFEIVSANDDGTYWIGNVVRGVYDTLPADHALGTRVFFIRDAGTTFLVDCNENAPIDTSGDGDQFVVVAD